MSNAFDIEKAKAGEPVECLWHGVWVRANVIGRSLSHGDFLVDLWSYQTQRWETPARVTTEKLRIAPKKVKVRYRNYKLCDAVAAGVSMIIDGPGWETPEVIEKKSWFRGWIHAEWQVAEVEQ